MQTAARMEKTEPKSEKRRIKESLIYAWNLYRFISPYTKQQIKMEDRAMEWLRGKLTPPEMQRVPVELCRSVWYSMEKSGDIPGSEEDRIEPHFVETALRKHKRMRIGSNLSKEYLAHLESDRWKCRAKLHKQFCEYHCQICGLHHDDPSTLDVHHCTYADLGNEKDWQLICVCGDGCHQAADILRVQNKERYKDGEYKRRGKKRKTPKHSFAIDLFADEPGGI